jgi:hypothetical protein
VREDLSRRTLGFLGGRWGSTARRTGSNTSPPQQSNAANPSPGQLAAIDRLYVFNTKWVADWGNWAFDPILGYKTNPLGGGTVFEALGPKLKECSSGEGFYFEGTDAAEIATTFRKRAQ